MGNATEEADTKFTVVVDQDAEPTDWDEAILDFIEKVIARRLSQGRPELPLAHNKKGPIDSTPASRYNKRSRPGVMIPNRLLTKTQT